MHGLKNWTWDPTRLGLSLSRLAPLGQVALDSAEWGSVPKNVKIQRKKKKGEPHLLEVTPNSLILEIEKGETQKEEGERGDEEMLIGFSLFYVGKM